MNQFPPRPGPDTWPLNPAAIANDQLRTSIWLVEMMVTLLRQYFGSTERIVFEKSRFIWSEDEASSQIFINNVDNLDYKNMGERPALLVDIEDHNFMEISIRDMLRVDAKNGIIEYTVPDKSSWSIECWALKKLEAMSLADEVRYFLATYREPLQQVYRFNKIRPKVQIKPVKYQDFTDYWIARVIVEFEMMDNWGLYEEQLRITGFSLKLHDGPAPKRGLQRMG